MQKFLTILTVTTVIVTFFPKETKALTFGEALGVGAGVLIIDKAIDNNQQRYQYRSPQEEYNRGLEDGFNRARYDNPRNSREYDNGYTQGRRRANQGWGSPFNR
jgi:hypothetical protein